MARHTRLPGRGFHTSIVTDGTTLQLIACTKTIKNRRSRASVILLYPQRDWCDRRLSHRRLRSALHHQTADCFISLDPGVVVRLRPVLPQKVREGLQQNCSDERIMLWPDPIGDMSLAQFLEHRAQHFWMLHVLDD